MDAPRVGVRRTEWSLQKQLTALWLEQSTSLIGGEPLFLVAWEVMTDYRINDARRYWSLPSIDFLFLDREGHLVALELKLAIRSPREAWSALCQVTHRAIRLAETYSEERLESAYSDCRRGLDGRQPRGEHPEPLHLSHARAFGVAATGAPAGKPVRRMVMAEVFGPTFDQVLAAFSDSPPAERDAILRRYAASKEFDRFLALPASSDLIDSSPVRALAVPT